MVQRYDWRTSDDRRDIVHRAVEALAQGQLVVFPTETVYGLAAFVGKPEAVDRLVMAKHRDREKPLTLAVGSAEEAEHYVAAVSKVGRRLMSRCWPGPVTIVFPQAGGSGLEAMPATIQQRFVSSQGIGLRVPDHPAILETIRLLKGPLALSSANLSGEADAIDADSAILQLGDVPDIVIDDRTARFAKPSTVIRLDDDGYSVIREGVLTTSRLRRLASRVITFVCTGNSCRSPMAEAICKRFLADELNCEAHELPDRGYTILSAGLAASSGGPASPGAVEAVLDYDANLDDHITQPMTAELMRVSDRIVTMTAEHRRMICSHWPQAGDKTTTLCGPEDVSDPIGQSIEAYQACARQIAESVRKLIESVRAEK